MPSASSTSKLAACSTGTPSITTKGKPALSRVSTRREVGAGGDDDRPVDAPVDDGLEDALDVGLVAAGEEQEVVVLGRRGRWPRR